MTFPAPRRRLITGAEEPAPLAGLGRDPSRGEHRGLVMKRWVKGQEIIDRGVQPFELLAAIREGKLTPIDPKSGMRIVDSASLEKIPRKFNSREEAAAALELESPSLPMGEIKSPADRAVELYRKAIREKEIEDLCSWQLIVPKGCIAIPLTLEKSLGLLFRGTEVARFLKEGEPADAPSPGSLQEAPAEAHDAAPVARTTSRSRGRRTYTDAQALQAYRWAYPRDGESKKLHSEIARELWPNESWGEKIKKRVWNAINKGRSLTPIHDRPRSDPNRT